jgi:hypothetical protein
VALRPQCQLRQVVELLERLLPVARTEQPACPEHPRLQTRERLDKRARQSGRGRNRPIFGEPLVPLHPVMTTLS